MASVLDIWNIALGRIASSAAVRSESEQSVSARDCARFWPNARDITLEAHDWPFARRTVRFVEFAPMVEQQGIHPAARLARLGWQYAYSRRAEALAVRRVIPLDGSARPVEYELGAWLDPEDESHTPLLFTNEPIGAVAFTTNRIPTTRYPPLFVEAVAWRLAMDLATGQPKSRELRADAAKAYDLALGEARVSVARQQHRLPPESELLLARA